MATKKGTGNRSGTPLGIRVEDEIMDRLTLLRLKHRYPPTLTAIVEDALRRYLDEEEPKLEAAKPSRPTPRPK